MLGHLQRSAAGEEVLTLTPEPSSRCFSSPPATPPSCEVCSRNPAGEQGAPRGCQDQLPGAETAVQPPASTKMEIRIPDFLTRVFSRLVLGNGLVFPGDDLVDPQRSKKNLTGAARASLPSFLLAPGLQSPPATLIPEMLLFQIFLAPANERSRNLRMIRAWPGSTLIDQIIFW